MADGRWIFTNGNNTPRVARIDLTTFRTAEIIELPNSAGNHSSPFIVAFFIAFGLIASYINKKMVDSNLGCLILIISFISIYDFYLWGYDYGHNLDPKAIIKISRQSYQPTVLEQNSF